MSEQKKPRMNFKEIFENQSYFKDLKTIVTFVLSYAIVIFTSGLFGGFNLALLWEFESMFPSLGLGFGLEIISREFANRASNDQNDKNEELQSIKTAIKTESRKIEYKQAKQALKVYNENEYTELKESAIEKEVGYLNNKKDKWEDLLNELNIFTFKWYHLRNKRKRKKANRKVDKINKKIAKINRVGVYVRYDYLSLEDIKIAEIDKKNSNMTRKERYNYSAEKSTVKNMRTSTIVRMFFFFGFQGAAISSIGSWAELFVYLLVVTSMIASSALTSYELTRRSIRNYTVPFLNDKLDTLKHIVSTQNLYKGENDVESEDDLLLQKENQGNKETNEEQ